MGIDVTVKIGGEAGQGIQTVGDLLAHTCHKAGLYIMAINDFESRIRGGHNFFQMRISDDPILAPNHNVNLLVALNEKTIDQHHKELDRNGITLMDKGLGLTRAGVLKVAFSDLAIQAGGKITSNTVAAGACLSLLGAPLDLFKSVLMERFGTKGEAVSEQNIKAAVLGYQAVEKNVFAEAFEWKRSRPRGILLDGSKTIALGALAGDCRMAAFYPMSPATGIMAQLNTFSDTFPLVVEQAEDEIAALNMALGASVAGVRAMTATSGGGFCLMTETLGLAGISETPVVIVNAQRPGPATGMATRTAQGDLHFVIRAGQDEFPRFVFAPGSPVEGFEIMTRAFHLSEKYQVPAIVLTDQFFNDSLYIDAHSFRVPETIERFIAQDEDMENPSQYKRYALLSSGISPRALPCRGEALVSVSGNEHQEDGHISEEIEDRINMVNKRNAKIPHMRAEMNPPQAYYGESELLLVGWGSTAGVIRESVDMLRAEGVDAGSLHFADIWPFRADVAVQALNKARRFMMVEQNSTAQLGQLIMMETGLHHAGAVLKYDGRPFFPIEIAEGIKKQIR